MHLQAAFDELARYGVRGLHVGFVREMATRSALLRGDAEAYERQLSELIRIYMAGKQPALVARVEGIVLAARERNLCSSQDGGSWDPATMERTATASGRRPSAARQKTAPAPAAAPDDLRRVLDLLIQRCGASSGHLYLARSGGIERVADVPARAPVPELDEHVRRYFERETARDTAGAAARERDAAGGPRQGVSILPEADSTLRCFLLSHASQPDTELACGVVVLGSATGRALSVPALELDALAMSLSSLEGVRCAPVT